MTNLRTDEMVFICNLTKIGTDENKAIYSNTFTSFRFFFTNFFMVYTVMASYATEAESVR